VRSLKRLGQVPHCPVEGCPERERRCAGHCAQSGVPANGAALHPGSSAPAARAQDARDGAAERPYPLAPPAVVFDNPNLGFPAIAAVSAAAARRAAQLAGPEPFLHALLLWVADHAAAAVVAAAARLAALEAAAAAAAPAQPERAADAPAPPAAAAGPGAGPRAEPGPRVRAGAAGGAPARRPGRGAAAGGGRAEAGPAGAGGAAAEGGGGADSGEDAEECAAHRRVQLLQRLTAQDDAVRGLASRRARHCHALQTHAWLPGTPKISLRVLSLISPARKGSGVQPSSAASRDAISWHHSCADTRPMFGREREGKEREVGHRAGAERWSAVHRKQRRTHRQMCMSFWEQARAREPATSHFSAGAARRPDAAPNGGAPRVEPAGGGAARRAEPVSNGAARRAEPAGNGAARRAEPVQVGAPRHAV